MKKVISFIVMIVMVLSVGLTGCGKKAEESNVAKETKPKFKVGFVFSGPISDGGWVQAHNQGRLEVEKQLKISTMFKENVPETQESEKVMEDMIAEGCNMIFACSFGYLDFVEKEAKKHPEVKFMHSAGYKLADNMSNYFGKIEEPRYLTGMVAAMQTKTNKLGYVAAFEIPQVIRGINAFTLGAQAVNPNVVVKVKWTHVWGDPAKEKEAAKALIDEGVDVIAEHQNTAGAQQAAEEKGIWSIGYHADMSYAAPKAQLTAAIWDFGPYYVEQTKKAMEGTWKSESYWGGMKDGIVKISKYNDAVPQKTKDVVAKAQEEIIAGKKTIFVGPLKDQSGTVKVQQGVVMTDKEVLNMNWFIQGVEGKTK